jgi:hypothetical protein
MGQEFFINSQQLEDKIRQLLPSQGGAGAGFDLSASTQIIPIIDVTESAEGSNIRQDLQSSLSFNTVTAFNVANATTSIITNTGYWRVFGTMTVINVANSVTNDIILNDGTTDKIILSGNTSLTNSTGAGSFFTFDFIVYLEAGHSLIAKSSSAIVNIKGSVRQLADIDGILVNP